MSISIELLGLIAGSCTTFAFLPQVVKVWKSRSVKDISIWMYLIFCSGLLMWIIYGFYINSTSLVVANIATLLLASAILTLKILWNGASPRH